MAALELRAVSKTYRVGDREILAVDDLSLSAGDGEIIGLLGSSGCGKTTTLRAIAGFVQLSAGRIAIDGNAIHNLPPARRGVAMAFEGYALYPPLRIRENIGFSLLRERRPGGEIQRAVREIAALLDIEDILDHYPAFASAGQQQRTSLARALIRRAPLTLLDEPMSQLDPQLRAQVRTRVKEYLAAHRLSAVFVTHDQNEAISLADRIAVMEQGRLQQFGTVGELKNRPNNLFVAGFIGEPPMNLMAAEVEAGGARVKLLGETDNRAAAAVGELRLNGAAPDLDAGRAHIGIRPHQVVLADDAPLRGRVISNQWLGDQSHVLVDLGGLRIVVVSAGRVRGLRKGENIGVNFPPDAVIFFSAKDGTALPRAGGHGGE
ncbi:MAG: ABC transporter ATP-binding protein [Gammaproteobacteria bacterium]|nr:ABC transporter ATP-binding protein [Gammaproteobacteria bacterium]